MTPQEVLPAGFCPTHLVIHYNEVALKGKNRSRFESALARNIESGLAGQGGGQVQRIFGRLLARLGSPDAWAGAASAAARVFGVAHILPVVRVEPTLEGIGLATDRALEAEDRPLAFAIQAKRSTKDFPFASMDVARTLGDRVRALKGWRVDLDDPELIIRVELVNGAAFLGFGRIQGPGGLPTGMAGRVACLLSGGIDSPVAAFQLLRRGSTAVYVHFHSYPHTGIESLDKARELASLVQPPGRQSPLYLVPFADLQRRIVAACPAPLRVLIYRRFMLRAAEAIARREGAIATVTGENLGQVASQTLENLRSIESVATLPVLRPLIGMDKIDIIAIARRIGTYETSIEPHGDCCSFLMPPNPATHSLPEELDAAEAAFDVSGEVDRLIAASEVEAVRCASAREEPVAESASPADLTRTSAKGEGGN